MLSFASFPCKPNMAGIAVKFLHVQLRLYRLFELKMAPYYDVKKQPNGSSIETNAGLKSECIPRFQLVCIQL